MTIINGGRAFLSQVVKVHDKICTGSFCETAAEIFLGIVTFSMMWIAIASI